MALVFKDEAVLARMPRQSRATQWDAPARHPKSGLPVFYAKTSAPNAESYCQWLKKRVLQNLEQWSDFEIPEGTTLASQLSPFQLVLCCLWYAIMEPAMWKGKLQVCNFRAILEGLSSANVYDKAEQIDARARKKLCKSFATNTATRWRDQVYYPDLVGSRLEPELVYVDAVMKPLPMQHGAPKKVLSNPDDVDDDGLLPSGPAPVKKRGAAEGQEDGADRAASAYSAAGYLWAAEFTNGTDFIDSVFVPLDTPLEETPIEARTEEDGADDVQLNSSSDQGSSEARNVQITSTVLPHVFQFGRAHRLSNNTKGLCKPVTLAAGLFNSFCSGPKGSGTNKTLLRQEAKDLQKIAETKPAPIYMKIPHVRDIQRETDAESLQEGMAKPITLIEATDTRWMRDFLFANAALHDGAKMKALFHRLHSKSSKTSLDEAAADAATRANRMSLEMFDGAPCSRPPNWLGYPGEVYLAFMECPPELLQAYVDIAKPHFDFYALVEVLDRTSSEKSPFLDRHGETASATLQSMRRLLDPKATKNSVYSTAELSELISSRRISIWKILMHETARHAGQSPCRRRMAATLFARIVNCAMFDSFDPQFGLMESIVKRGRTISRPAANRLGKFFSGKLAVNCKRMLRCLDRIQHFEKHGRHHPPPPLPDRNCAAPLPHTELDALAQNAVFYGAGEEEVRLNISAKANDRIANRRRDTVFAEQYTALKSQQQELYNRCRFASSNARPSMKKSEQTSQNIAQLVSSAPAQYKAEHLGFRGVEAAALLYEFSDEDELTAEGLLFTRTLTKRIAAERQLSRRMREDPTGVRQFLKHKVTGRLFRITQWYKQELRQGFYLEDLSDGWSGFDSKEPERVDFWGGWIFHYFLYDGEVEMRTVRVVFGEEYRLLHDRWVDPWDFAFGVCDEFSVTAQVGGIHMLLGGDADEHAHDDFIRQLPQKSRSLLYRNLAERDQKEKRRLLLRLYAREFGRGRGTLCQKTEKLSGSGAMEWWSELDRKLAARALADLGDGPGPGTGKSKTGGVHDPLLKRQPPAFVYRLHRLEQGVAATSGKNGQKKKVAATTSLCEFRSYRAEQGASLRLRAQWLEKYKPTRVRMPPTVEIKGRKVVDLVMSELLPYAIKEFQLAGPQDCFVTDDANAKKFPIPPAAFQEAAALVKPRAEDDQDGFFDDDAEFEDGHGADDEVAEDGDDVDETGTEDADGDDAGSDEHADDDEEDAANAEEASVAAGRAAAGKDSLARAAQPARRGRGGASELDKTRGASILKSDPIAKHKPATSFYKGKKLISVEGAQIVDTVAAGGAGCCFIVGLKIVSDEAMTMDEDEDETGALLQPLSQQAEAPTKSYLCRSRIDGDHALVVVEVEVVHQLVVVEAVALQLRHQLQRDHEDHHGHD
eukprot:g14603.t1